MLQALSSASKAASFSGALECSDRACHNDDCITQTWRRGLRARPDVLSKGAFRRLHESFSAPSNLRTCQRPGCVCLVASATVPSSVMVFGATFKAGWNLFGAKVAFSVTLACSYHSQCFQSGILCVVFLIQPVRVECLCHHFGITGHK